MYFCLLSCVISVFMYIRIILKKKLTYFQTSQLGTFLDRMNWVWFLIRKPLCSGLPYDVTVEQALEYEAVRERIGQSIQALKSSTDMFLDSLFRNVDKIP